VWFADVPAIAQLYIARSGLSIYISPSHLVRPSQDVHIQAIQKAIGIDYDISDATWDRLGRPQSFSLPKGWSSIPTPQEIMSRLQRLGYDIEYQFTSVEFNIGDNDKLLLPGKAEQGYLYVSTTLRDMTLWNKSTGEGDLLDLQYNDLRGFREAENIGLDGVVIDDFAQSEQWGNLGHTSVGLFRHAIKSLRTKRVPAQYREFEYGKFGTPDYPRASAPYFHKLR